MLFFRGTGRLIRVDDEVVGSTDGCGYLVMNIYERLLVAIDKINDFWKIIIYGEPPNSQELNY